MPVRSELGKKLWFYQYESSFYDIFSQRGPKMHRFTWKYNQICPLQSAHKNEFSYVFLPIRRHKMGQWLWMSNHLFSLPIWVLMPGNWIWNFPFILRKPHSRAILVIFFLPQGGQKLTDWHENIIRSGHYTTPMHAHARLELNWMRNVEFMWRKPHFGLFGMLF